MTYHFMYSTKGRIAALSAAIRGGLFGCIVETWRSLECVPMEVGGAEDHVHFLVAMEQGRPHAPMIRRVKEASEKWMRESEGVRDFAWQEWYAWFEVSPANVRAVRKYVAGQDEVHRKMSYKVELISLLKMHKIDFDPVTIFE